MSTSAGASSAATDLSAPSSSTSAPLPNTRSWAHERCASVEMSLQNIVSTTNLGLALDLKKIALTARNAEYNPKRFSAVIVRIRDPKTTALIFQSGKMVVTGAKTEHDSKLAAKKYARIVKKIGFGVRFLNFKIQNMVSTVDVQFPIRLEGLVCEHAKFCSYEPELFPGLIYRMVSPKIVFLVFVSGKCVLTGAKTRQQLQDAFENMYHVLLRFKKTPRVQPLPSSAAVPMPVAMAAGGSGSGSSSIADAGQQGAPQQPPAAQKRPRVTHTAVKQPRRTSVASSTGSASSAPARSTSGAINRASSLMWDA